MSDGQVCEKRNLNGPMVTVPLNHRSHVVAVVMGIGALFTIPWDLSSAIMNLGFMRDEDYSVESTVPLDCEMCLDSTGLSRHIMSRIRSLGTHPSCPLIIEYSFQKSKTSYPFALHCFNFLKVIKKIQTEYVPPIIVVMDLASPYRNCTTNSYEAAKRKAAEYGNIAMAMGHLLHVPVLQLVVQRKPCLEEGTEAFEYLIPSWAQVPLFNKHGEQTLELKRRICASLSFLLDTLRGEQIPYGLIGEEN
jgi:hypothetical protein